MSVMTPFVVPFIITLAPIIGPVLSEIVPFMVRFPWFVRKTDNVSLIALLVLSAIAFKLVNPMAEHSNT